MSFVRIFNGENMVNLITNGQCGDCMEALWRVVLFTKILW